MFYGFISSPCSSFSVVSKSAIGHSSVWSDMVSGGRARQGPGTAEQEGEHGRRGPMEAV